MSISVRKANFQDWQPVSELLQGSTLNSAWIPVEVRKPMFQNLWGGDEDYCGYVLTDESRIVGFLGLLFTAREVSGEWHKFCEVHSWYVEEEYRNESMKLFLPALSVKGMTIVNFTPTQSVYDISIKFGFKDLETGLRMLYPVPTVDTFRNRCAVEVEGHRIVQYLDPAERRIYIDHENVQAHHLLIRPHVGSEYCYIIVKRMTRRGFEKFGRILYVSNMALFLEHADYLRAYLCLRFGFELLVANDAEFDGHDNPSFSKVAPREVPSVFKSRTLGVEDIKPLYSLPLLIGYRLH